MGQNYSKLSTLSMTDAPKIVVTPPGPRSSEIIGFQNSHESSAVSYPKGNPIAIKQAKGATIEDEDGNIFIDMFSGAGVMVCGHSHPEILEAAHAQIEKVSHTLDIPTQSRVNLVKELQSVLPKELTRVFFGGPTGSDAVEQAIKLAKWNTKRRGIIAFEGSYHGMTAGALAVTSDMYHKSGVGPLMPEVSFVPFPYEYRNPFGCPCEDLADQALARLESVLSDGHSGVEKPAAIIIECFQGEGGSIVPDFSFLKGLREICDRHEIILICDEVQVGFGRTGKMFAFEHAGIVPDIVVLSKALGGGFPIAAIAYKEELNTWPAGKSIGTFRGNMIAFAAGQKAIEIIKRDGLVEHSRDLGAKLKAELKKLEQTSAVVGEVRGQGLFIGIEIVSDKEKKTAAPDLAKKVRDYVVRHGLIIEVGGHSGNVLRLLPPLVITEELAFKGIEILTEGIRGVE